ncbi:MAG: formaldehyde-activating enzyme, partial [Methylocystis silviterrae]
NYEATKLAISRAMKGEPTADELIANRKSVQHYALEGVFED